MSGPRTGLGMHGTIESLERTNRRGVEHLEQAKLVGDSRTQCLPRRIARAFAVLDAVGFARDAVKSDHIRTITTVQDDEIGRWHHVRYRHDHDGAGGNCPAAIRDGIVEGIDIR